MRKSVVTGAFALLMGMELGAAEAPKCPLPGEWEFDAETSDEFNGDKLDLEKWWNFLPFAPGRPGGFRWLAKNVRQDNGTLKIVASDDPIETVPYEQRMEGMTGLACGAVKSRKKVCYGYFEARMKSSAAAVRNAFWLYDPLSDKPEKKYAPGEISEEIDIAEIEGCHQPEDANRPYAISMFTHQYITPYYECVVNRVNVPNGHWAALPFNPSEGFHTYGLLWEPNRLTWYVDGKEFSKFPNWAGYSGWYRPLHVVFDAEIVDWAGCKLKTLDRSKLPATAEVDWFRHWTKVEKK